METEYYIAKDRQLLPSQDFQFLLKAGLQYVENLGQNFWTDYNPHDPGITILDVLCYAITELGYRADFDIKDLLTHKDGILRNHTFFSPATIFTNAPLTSTDYRKMLIDIDGVSNAWLLATKKSKDTQGYFLPNEAEASLYLNKLEDKLSLKSQDKKNNPLNKLNLRGLSKVKIELDEDPVLGDLNTLLLENAFWKENRWVSYKIIPQFTNWNHPDSQLFKNMNKPSKITIASVKKMQDIVLLLVNRYSKPKDSLHFRIFPQDKSEIDLIVKHFNTEAHVCEIISLFEQKRTEIQKIFSKVALKLQQNRNLTEDYLCTEIIEKILIGICADIELKSGVDAVEVMSQIQIAIDNVISPKINFYTLTQLVNEGWHTEDIFLGPRLENGFLKDEEIAKATLAKQIHASDIIAELMKIAGIQSVKNFLMTGYNELGKPISGITNKNWVLELSGEVKPVFSASQSKLLLFQKNIPFLLNESQQMLVEQKVFLYKAQSQQKKLKDAQKDFTIENGDYYELQKYFSIQDEFPIVYRLGKNYVSEKDTDLRKAQAKQLKGYLYFYEQILSDFFSQLHHAKDLLDTNTLDRTYFLTYLEKNDLTEEDFYSKELYANDLKQKLLYGESNEEVSLQESKTTFFDRRNRALDHLIARFSESFSDYVFMMYQVSQDTSGLGALSFDNDDLIIDKQNFINNYPEISCNRGQGMDYLNASLNDTSGTLDFNTFWNSNHRGGYEKRVARLLGIGQIPLRDIVTEEGPQTQWTVETETENFLFKIVSPTVNLAVKWEWSQLHFLNQNLYKIYSNRGKYFLYLMNDSFKIARFEKRFDTAKEAYDFLQRMMKILNLYYENFYCLEHILLRPFTNSVFTDDDLLTVCLNDDCDDEAKNDPYSFKATIVLPGYLSRFKSLIFRKYAEQVFRQEAPAHTLLKICWVNISDMLGFQKTYKKWVEDYRFYRWKFCENNLTVQDEKNYRDSLHELVLALKELNTIYPEGNLYDCQLSESKNPIILGNTSLGTL
jgi:hypothetical protein